MSYRPSWTVESTSRRRCDVHVFVCCQCGTGCTGAGHHDGVSVKHMETIGNKYRTHTPHLHTPHHTPCESDGFQDHLSSCSRPCADLRLINVVWKHFRMCKRRTCSCNGSAGSSVKQNTGVEERWPSPAHRGAVVPRCSSPLVRRICPFVACNSQYTSKSLLHKACNRTIIHRYR